MDIWQGFGNLLGGFVHSTLVLDKLRVDGPDPCGGPDVSSEWMKGVLQQLSSLVLKLVFEVTAAGYSQLSDPLAVHRYDREPRNPAIYGANSYQSLGETGSPYEELSVFHQQG